MGDAGIPTTLHLQNTCSLKANKDHSLSNFHVCSRIPPTASCKWRNRLCIHPAALLTNLGSHSSTQQNVKYLPSSNSLSRAFHPLPLCLCSCSPRNASRELSLPLAVLNEQGILSLTAAGPLLSLLGKGREEGGQGGCSPWHFYPKKPFHDVLLSFTYHIISPTSWHSRQTQTGNISTGAV